MQMLFHPGHGRAADFIPFYWKGRYHLFYLRVFDDLTNRSEGTPWHQVVSRDFVNFADWGEAIPCGADGAQDVWIFTGSVVERNGEFLAFYTAHNRHMREKGKPTECVALARSKDLRRWKKEPSLRIFPPVEAGYEAHDWRDPFIYWDERCGEWGMLLAARNDRGPSRHRGCTALLTSPDMKSWTRRQPFWAPDQYQTHECPDLFKIGRWWYLVYSTFSESCITHYRMSRSLSGPWRAPKNADGGDSFDGRAYYAAKTAGDGKRRYAFGWLPTREDRKDDGKWHWGGTLVVHEIAQQPDGTLTVRIPRSVAGAFKKKRRSVLRPLVGIWRKRGAAICADAAGRFSAASLGKLPDCTLIEATVRFNSGTENAGLLLRADAAMEKYYQLRIEPLRQRIVIDRWPRPGDVPFMLERPLRLRAGEPVRLRVLLDDSCMVAYANDKVALSCRLYEHRAGELGVFVTNGRAEFSSLSLKER